jgi:hypothetical protein
MDLFMIIKTTDMTTGLYMVMTIKTAFMTIRTRVQVLFLIIRTGLARV